MPFAVKQWADSPDPRDPAFNLDGWDHGQLPPWRWLVKTTNATGIWTIFNTGVVVEFSFGFPNDSGFEEIATLPDDITVILKILGSQLPIGPGAGITKSIGLILLQGGEDKWSGGNEQLYPTAIAVWTLPILAEDNPSDGTVPDVFTLTPRKWNVD